MSPPTLIESAAPFARLADPSDVAYDVAASIEHYLITRQRQGHPLLTSAIILDLALVIEPDLSPLHKRIAKLERAFGVAYQVAATNGAGEAELRDLHALIEEAS